MMTLRLLFFSIVFSLGQGDTDQTSNSSKHQIYLDVKPANTTWHLQAIRALPLSTYRLAYERSSAERVRVGVIGPDLAAIIPDAVDIVPKRTLPPIEPGGKPIIQENVPVINEQTLFMYGLGATKEIASLLDELDTSMSSQMDQVVKLYGEVAQLEHLMIASSDGRAEAQARAATAQARIIQAETELEIRRARDEEEYENAVREAEMEQIRRSEELTIDRLEREDEAARVRAQEAMQMKFEASQMAERKSNELAESLSAIEHERALAMQRASESLKAKTAEAVAKAKAEAERANEDVHLRRLKAESEQRRLRTIAGIHTFFQQVSSSLSAVSKNPRQVFSFIGYITLLAVAIYTAREAARLCRLVIESVLGKPKLVRETTRKSFIMSLLSTFLERIFVSSLYRKVKRIKPFEEICEKVFEDLILSSSMKERVIELAVSSSKARRHNAPHRHILLYGPPGTGKTMVAKKLAHSIGLDYALMSGGDVGPLGPDAVTQIHNLFSWAKFSQKGVLLFIDEAEAFLGNRSKAAMTESAHNALNALLYNTGGERRDFMLVLATNRAEDLDAAVLDRCDESLLFPLPDSSCRSKLISLYYDIHVKQVAETNNKMALSLCARFKDFFSKNKPFLIDIHDGVMEGDELCRTVKATKGFSGREIGKLMIAMQGAIYASEDGVLSKERAWKVVETKVSEHKDKKAMVGLNVLSRAGIEEKEVQ